MLKVKQRLSPMGRRKAYWHISRHAISNWTIRRKLSIIWITHEFQSARGRWTSLLLPLFERLMSCKSGRSTTRSTVLSDSAWGFGKKSICFDFHGLSPISHSLVVKSRMRPETLPGGQISHKMATAGSDETPKSELCYIHRIPTNRVAHVEIWQWKPT